MVKSEYIAFYIFNYNQPVMTDICIQLLKYAYYGEKLSIFVVDSSDKFKFESIYDDVNVIYANECIDIESQLPDIEEDGKDWSNNGSLSFISARHSIQIQYILDTTEYKHIVLLDNDVLFKKKLDWIDDSFISVGALCQNNFSFARIHPMCQYINVEKARARGIKYYSKHFIISSKQVFCNNGLWYETGSWFLQQLDVKDRKFIDNIDDYVQHIGCQSYAQSSDIYLDALLQNSLYKDIMVQACITLDIDIDTDVLDTDVLEVSYEQNLDKVDSSQKFKTAVCKVVSDDVNVLMSIVAKMLLHLEDNGRLVLYNTLPYAENQSSFGNKYHFGIAWKVAYVLKSLVECKHYTLNAFPGITVFEFNDAVDISCMNMEYGKLQEKLDWNFYIANRKRQLNII